MANVAGIQCFVIREEDFKRAKAVQDILKADEIVFMTRKKFNEYLINNTQTYQNLFGLNKIRFEEAKIERNFIERAMEKLIGFIKEKIGLL